MRIHALGLNAIRAACLVLQEVQRQPGLPEDLRSAACNACVGYPGLASVRAGLWTSQPDMALGWGAALTRAREVLDRLLALDADPDIRELARYANRHFPTHAQLVGCRWFMMRVGAGRWSSLHEAPFTSVPKPSRPQLDDGLPSHCTWPAGAHAATGCLQRVRPAGIARVVRRP